MASLLIGLILVLAATGIHAQVNGRLIDALTSDPVPAATVSELDSAGTVLIQQTSHANGEFRMRRARQAVSVRIHALGYHDTAFAISRDTTTRIARLSPNPSEQEEVLITATRQLSTIQQVPVSSEVMHREEIESRSPNGLDDVLPYIQGVTVTDQQVSIRGSSGFSYGVGSRVLLMLDGMPMLSGDEGDIEFDAIPLFDIDHIEVVKGAGSALYGSSALGGVINVITQTPEKETHGIVSAYGGMYSEPSYTQWQVPSLGREFGSLDGGLTTTIGNLGLIGSLGYKRNEGYEFGNDYYRWHGFVKGVLPVTENTQFSIEGLVANENHAQWVFWRSLAAPLMPFDSTTDVNGRIHSLKADIVADLRSIIGNSTIADLKMSMYHTRYTTDADSAGAIPTGRSDAGSWNAEGTLSFPLSATLFLTNGVDAGLQVVHSDQYGDREGALGAAFTQAEYKPVDNFTFNAGLRYDFVPIYSVSLFSPKIGATYQPIEDLTMRASFGSGFRAPTISERFIQATLDGFNLDSNSNLQPEYSKSYEYGINYRPSPYYTLDAAVFYSTFTNLIEPTIVLLNGGAPYIQFQNVTTAALFGHEEHFDLFPFGNRVIGMHLGYTYVYPENTVTHQILPYRPRNLVQLGLESTLGIFNGSVDFRYISKYEMTDSLLSLAVPDANERVDARILDARVSCNLRTVGVPATLTVQALNLLNYYYVEIAGNLAPLRSFSLRLDTTF